MTWLVNDVGGTNCSNDKLREIRELERAKAVAGPAGKHPDAEVLER